MSRIRANTITNQNANGAPNFPDGITVSGIVTATGLNQTSNSIVVGSAVTANSQGIDVTGIVTATNVSVGSSVTAATFHGSGAGLTGITQTTINNNANNRVITGSGTANTLEAESSFTFDAGQGVITGNQAQLRVSGSTQGRILYTDTGATSNKQSFDITSEGDSLRFRSLADDINSVRANAMTIAGDTGYVNFPTKPIAHVGKNNGNVSASNYIIWNVAHINQGNMYNTSDGKFTVPITGMYFVSFFSISSGNSTMDYNLRINGSDYQGMCPYSAPTGGNHIHVSGSAVLSLNAGQYIQMYISNGTFYGTGTNGRHGGMTVYLLS